MCHTLQPYFSMILIYCFVNVHFGICSYIFHQSIGPCDFTTIVDSRVDHDLVLSYCTYRPITVISYFLCHWPVIEYTGIQSYNLNCSDVLFNVGVSLISWTLLFQVGWIRFPPQALAPSKTQDEGRQWVVCLLLPNDGDW